jgi:hypothetical protein
MKIVNQDLWLGMSSASNGAKSFARITLDFTIKLLQNFFIGLAPSIGKPKGILSTKKEKEKFIKYL